MEPDLQPSVPEVLQAETETPLTTVPVRVQQIDNPVRTQELPRKAATTKTVSITTTPLRILPADPFRAGGYLISFDQDFLVAFDNGSKEDPSRMARWPKTVPYPLHNTAAVWVAAFTATTSISTVSERWATGEN